MIECKSQQNKVGVVHNNVANNICSESENAERSEHICGVPSDGDSSLRINYFGLEDETDLRNLVEEAGIHFIQIIFLANHLLIINGVIN